MEAHDQAVQRLMPEACGRRWIIERTSDLETLWESIGEDDFGGDERLPYWSELWPSSLTLADWLCDNAGRIQNRTCLDMGCGLGLTAIVGTSLGAQVVAFDYEVEPLRFAMGNATANAVPQPLWLQMDWRDPAIRRGRAGVIWGGDIVYETRFIEPVGRFIDLALSPDGVAWIAEPGRNIGPPFIRWMREHGFSCERALTRRFPHEDHSVTVHILEIQRDA
ncbi:class I SAM-dependent methyltransferase [Desulfovibrio ferrophilus]|uniref:Methyltransferase n=1 Tax=Desulfovibrio ferrophilus TaxID=241368 RepID=A0A2Z6AXE7_9BACT|nr:50S ribosomal protein L11 methyltransferase [Desulfovibrio ferrophilus]BBD07932.1 uncharacterized protein DFE_1206 [Desulfovibrio ferrophilus]